MHHLEIFIEEKNILVHCVKNKKSNLLEYDAINKILIKNILALD